MTTGGAVHAGRDQSSDASVLLKLPAEAGNASGLRREQFLLQAVDAPEVLKPLALLDDGVRPVLVLEPFDGEGLDAVLARGPRFSLLVALTVALQAARAVAALHTAGIVHGDLRPANFLLGGTGECVQVKLVDLSRATARDAGAFPPASGHDWAYVSPEQTGRMQRPAATAPTSIRWGCCCTAC